jgi:hypothetical protein
MYKSIQFSDDNIDETYGVNVQFEESEDEVSKIMEEKMTKILLNIVSYITKRLSLPRHWDGVYIATMESQ